MKENEGRLRVVIEGVKPEIDCGRFPIKRIIGDRVVVEADIFADGHDALCAFLLHRRENNPAWTEVPMEFLVNDHWRGSFIVREQGHYRYTLTAWVDQFKSWQEKLAKKDEAGQDISVELLVGAELVAATVQRAAGNDASSLRRYAESLRASDKPITARIEVALDKRLAALMARYPDRQFATTYARELGVVVDREKARFSTWYEMFPRSCAPVSGKHGTFKDCEARLDYVAGMGFDVLYLPPIHPIGHTNRKGKNNAVGAGPGDPGTPWAIGSAEGGHKAVHPQLGTIDDFRSFRDKARQHGLEVALDLAFNCSPDHPYVKEHPEWFRWRPDNTVQFAENPPKKYEDIYPLEFDSSHWRELWTELKSIVLFWIEQGVRIFRVDNPHTKPFDFWEWLIAEVKRDHPDVIFLAEAFTRPKPMYRLAKLGFDQSYTYFTWRNAKWELTQYFTELAQTEVREFYRPNLWPNTPDILSDYLRDGGRPAFMARLVLAATLSPSYGIYGPAYELGENRRRDNVSEEYLDSEKYEIKHWDIDRPDSLKDFIARVNRIRRENPALQANENLRFHPIENDQLICYSKRTDDSANIILVVLNLDYRRTQNGNVELCLEDWGFPANQSFAVHDLLTGARYQWHGRRNYVELSPAKIPAHVFRVER